MSAGATPVGDGGGARSLSLDDLVALNDEIVALVRAGLPLEPGLTGARRDLRGRLGRVVERISGRLKGGAGLPEALEAERGAIPPLYQAVVEAGLRSGRPAVALEGLADYVRRYQETRRVLGLALMYPLVVLLLGYGLFVLFVFLVAPRFVDAFDALRVPGRGGVAMIARLGEWAPYWGPVVPAVVGLLVLAWMALGRTGALGSGLLSASTRWVPWLGGMLAEARTANFAELLALLLEGGIALPEAIELAAGASGDAAMRRDAAALAESIRRGEPAIEALRRFDSGPGGRGRRKGSFPPLLRWLMGIGERRGAIEPALRHAADIYRRRAIHRAEMIRTFLPTLLLLVIGIATVSCYALTLFVPFTSLLDGLSSAAAGQF